MPSRDMTNEEIQNEVIHRLYRRHFWVAKYLPIGSIVSWLGKLVIKNGHKVRHAIDELAKNGFLIYQKKRTVVSLDPKRVDAIHQLLEEK